MKKQHNETADADIIVYRPKDFKVKQRPLWRPVLLLMMVTAFSAGIYAFSWKKEIRVQKEGDHVSAFLVNNVFNPLNVEMISLGFPPAKEMNQALSETSEEKQQHRAFSELQYYFHKIHRNSYYFVTASLMTAFISLLTGLFVAVKYIKEKKFKSLTSKGEKIIISSTIFRDALKRKKSFNAINWKF